MINSCPDSWEKRNKGVLVSEEEKQEKELTLLVEDVVLFTSYNKDDVLHLGLDSRNCAVIDTACSSTVCGNNWFQCFKSSLSESDLNNLEFLPGEKYFKFRIF